jgi:toxin FitB
MPESVLLDTNVVSELARKTPNPNVLAFVAATPRALVSVVLFHELGFGVETAPPEHRARLAAFLSAMREHFGRRAVAVDLEIAELAGRLRAFKKSAGRILTVSDSLIAATAITRNAPLATRNVKDFKKLGLTLVNPFDPGV